MRTSFRSLVALLAVSNVALGDRDPASLLAALRGGARRVPRAELIGAAEDADRKGGRGEPGAFEAAAGLYLLSYRGHRVAEDLTTAIDRLERAARSGGATGCAAAHSVAQTYAELVGPASGYLAFHRLRALCQDAASKDAAARALQILASFRPEPAALAAVERDPSAPLPPRAAPAPQVAVDAGVGVDAGRDGGAAAVSVDAAPTKRVRDVGPERMRIRFSDAGE